jgi:hypothetical protein
MIDRLIEDERDLNRLIAFLRHQKLPFTARISDGRVRSIEQNRLQWLWAAEAAMQRQDVTAREVQAEWKLRFGVPILAADNEDFAATALRLEVKLSYEERLELMEFVSVTSLMTTKQLKSFLDQVYQYNAERGIELTVPEDLKYASPYPAGMDRRPQRNGNSPAGKAPRRKASTRAVR